jgi:hypothetical protein
MEITSSQPAAAARTRSFARLSSRVRQNPLQRHNSAALLLALPPASRIQLTHMCLDAGNQQGSTV